MTKNQKVKAYRKAAELIYKEDMAIDNALTKVYGNHFAWNASISFMFFSNVNLQYYMVSDKKRQEYRVIILLSCAELVRLDFEIE